MCLWFISIALVIKLKWKLGKRSKSKQIKSFQSPAVPFDIWMLASIMQTRINSTRPTYDQHHSHALGANGRKTWHYYALIMADTFQIVVRSSCHFFFRKFVYQMILIIWRKLFLSLSFGFFSHMATPWEVSNEPKGLAHPQDDINACVFWQGITKRPTHIISVVWSQFSHHKGCLLPCEISNHESCEADK